MFQVGDVVVCVREFPIIDPAAPAQWHPKVGAYYRVHSIMDAGFLELMEDPERCDPDYGWYETHFRKVVAPDSKVARAIRACRDAHSPAPVA